MKRCCITTWLITLLIFTANLCNSAELLILTEDLPPLNYLDNGKLVGPSVDIVREIQLRVGSTDQIHVYPWARAYRIALEQENVVLFGTTYTKNREKLFKWVGSLASKQDILIAKKDAPFEIHSLDDAKQAGTIGTLRDDTRHEYLVELGFTNLEPVSDDKQNAQKLAMGRLDLWAYKIPGMNTVCELAGIDPAQFNKVLDLRTVEVKIAFSRKSSDSIVEQWRKAYTEMQEDGTLEEIRKRWDVE